MDNQTLTTPDLVDQATGQLRKEYEVHCALFEAQPQIVQRFLETQAGSVAEAINQKLSQVHFKLPDRVILGVGEPRPVPVPEDHREQMAGGLVGRLARLDLQTALSQRLVELEEAPEKAVTVAAKLVRFSTAHHMVHTMLPSGRSVSYRAEDGEEIPTIPVVDVMEAESAIMAPTDAVVEEGQAEAGRGELLVPYVPAARRFFLPQWVAFDDQGQLLVNSVEEAEAHVASMQRFLSILHSAFALAPYIIADVEYQQKRYGMLGQLINQGRALARYETREIIRTIQRRAAAQDLNRGLSLSLPYFEDQDLVIKMHDFEVIPAGRIMFVPAFVVRSVRMEEVKVAQDTRLSPSTRKHLLEELRMLEQAFDTQSGQ